MADQFIQVPTDGAGKKVATFEKTEATQVVQIQKVLLAGQTPDDDVLPANAAPGASVYAMPVRKGDGHDVALGAMGDADTALTVIGRLKKLLTLLPAALVSGRLDVNIGAPATLPVSAASLPLPSGAATETTLGTRLSEADFDTKAGSLTETAPATDTASSGLNGRLQRIAQRLTTLLSGGLPAALGANGGLKVEGVASGTVVPISGTVTANAGTGTRDVQGNVAHDGADSGNPVKVGYKAVDHGANPTAVAASDRTDGYANRHGIPFVIGGHMNPVPFQRKDTAVQTDAVLVSVGAGEKFVLTWLLVTCDNANTVDVQALVEWDRTTDERVVEHPGIPKGGGFALGNGGGILGIGGDAEDLLWTCEVPTGGSITVQGGGYKVPA